MPKFQSEQDLNRFLDSIKDEAKEARGELDKNIADNLNQFRGKQWNSKSSPAFLNNIIESAIEDKVGKLSETRPNITVLPTVNGLDAVAEILSKAVSGIWDRRKVEYKSERVALWGCISGVAFVGTPYNHLLNGGVGDADFIIKDPRTCGIDICVTNPEDADLGEYTVIEDFVALDQVRNDYPGRGALVKPDARIGGYTAQPEHTAQNLLRGAWSRLFGGKKAEKTSAIPKAIIEEFYVQDRRASIEDTGVVPIVDGLTTWAPDKGIPFPGGRRILRAGDVILCDEFNPFWDGAPPLDMLGWKIDPETAWAGDEIRGVKRMQQAHNRLGDAYTKSALLNTVVRVIMDQGALSPTEQNKLSNEVGQIIEKAMGRTLEYQVPPVLPVDIINFATTLGQWIREKIGVADPPLSKQVPSIVTGPAIEGLQLMLQTPIRTAARRIEEFYQRIGQKLVSRIFQFYTSDRIIHLIGPDQKWAKFEFNRLNMLKDKNGKIRSQEDVRKAYRDFYFTIEPGSSLAVTKTQRAQSKFLLVQMGLLHPEEILMEFYKNPQDKLKRAQEAKEQGLYAGLENNKAPQMPGQNGNMAA